MAAVRERRAQSSSRPTSPDDFLGADPSLFDYPTAATPQIQLVKPSYQTVSDETLYDLGILQGSQQLSHSGLALNLQYLTPQQYMMPNKEESLELEDYVQGLNDRFELPSDQILPMTPRASFDQGSQSYFWKFANMKQ
jgi:hypothetical protein